MMKKSNEVRKSKIITYYALVIVVPSVALGILAFRGIRNDQALVEKEQRRVLLETGERITSEISEVLDSLEGGFPDPEGNDETYEIPFFSDSIVELFVTENQLIASVFKLSKGNDLHALRKSFLYVPDSYNIADDAPANDNVSSALEEGWKFEFRDKDYERAIRHYSVALEKATSERGKGELLNVIARLHRKNGDLKGALFTYRIILDKFPGIYLSRNIPLGLSAMREMIKLHLEEGQREEALALTKLMIHSLMTSQWLISRSYYVNCMEEIHETMAGIDSADPGFRKNIDTLRVLRQRTDYLLSFMVEGDRMAVLVRENGSGRFRVRNNENLYFLSVLKKESGTWVILIDQNRFLDAIVIPFLQKNAIREGFSWSILDDDQVVLAEGEREASKEDASPVRFQLHGGMPAWTFVFYPVTPDFMSSIMDTGEGIYFYIFILILLILSFGLLFTLYTVNNELRLAKMKSHFISTVSHEFRSPLTSIRQMAEMLEQERVPSEERRKKYYTSILQQSERLTHLVENILNFAKMEEGRRSYRFASTDLMSLVERVVSSFRLHLSDKDFIIDLKAEGAVPEVSVDTEAMEQVVHNLIDNAVKYSDSVQRIEIRLGIQNDEVCIAVQDFGIGIPGEEQEKVFSRFYRAGDELTQKVKGSGIGLTIVKQIVLAHGGRMQLDSKPGKGSTFYVYLPLKK